MPECIRQERLRMGLTVDEVAGALGVDVADVVAWERGEVEPTTSQLKSLWQLLGCSLDWLVGLVSAVRCGAGGLIGGHVSDEEKVLVQATG